MRIILVLCTLLLSACVTMPSDVKYNYSNSTKSKEVYMKPGNLFNDKDIMSYTLRLGLYKTSLMDDNSLVMTVQVPGLENIQGLMINIDGVQTNLKPIDSLTSHEYIKGNSQSVGESESSKRFETTISFVQKMMNSKEVWVRVDVSKNYVEANFFKHKDTSYTAYVGFKKFFNQLYKVDEKYAYLADPKSLPPTVKVIQPSIAEQPIEEPAEKEYHRIYSPVDRKVFRHQDEFVDILIIPKTYSNSLPIMFENRSNEAIRIIWDESAFVNHKGEAEKIIHEGVLLKDKSLSQMPTIIPPKANIKDSISPVNKIVILPSSRDWGYLNICGDDVDWPEIGTIKEEECIGKIFGLFLTYEVSGRKKSVLLKYKYDKREEVVKTKSTQAPTPGQPEISNQSPVVKSNLIIYSSEKSTGFQFGLGLSTWLASSTQGTASTSYRAANLSGSSKDKIDGDYSGGFSWSLNLRNIPDSYVGFSASFEYLTNASGSDFTESVEFSGYLIKGNIVKSVGDVYFYAGGNIPNYQVSLKGVNIPGYRITYDTSSQMGAQGGIGILANKNVAVEIEYELLQMEIKVRQTSTTNPNTDYMEQKMQSYLNNIKIGMK